MLLRSAKHMATPGISTNDGKRFVVRADEKLTAFVELESAIRGRNDNRHTFLDHSQ
jgi:hypothetical protein